VSQISSIFDKIDHKQINFLLSVLLGMRATAQNQKSAKFLIKVARFFNIFFVFFLADEKNEAFLNV
jgi:hypothetical protein